MGNDTVGYSSNAELLRRLGQRGYAGCIVSMEHLPDLRESIEISCRNGAFDDEFYRECLSGFVYSPPAELPEAQSLIVVAVRQPQVRFTFTWKGSPAPAIVPPTYLHARETDRQVQETLAGLLTPGGYQAAPAVVPKKLLAVHSGLATYGRNNITYVAGMGSFHRLVAFYSDLPCEGGEWQALTMMERCQSCRACSSQCPTGAIGPDRFLLHAERCIVFHNEKPRAVSFPAWLDAAWHNCLVGCMLCQRVCPENQGFVEQFEEGAKFSQEETELIVAGAPLDQIPPAMKKKLEVSDLAGMMDILPRNLAALLERRR